MFRKCKHDKIFLVPLSSVHFCPLPLRGVEDLCAHHCSLAIEVLEVTGASLLAIETLEITSASMILHHCVVYYINFERSDIQILFCDSLDGVVTKRHFYGVLQA